MATSLSQFANKVTTTLSQDSRVRFLARGKKFVRIKL